MITEEYLEFPWKPFQEWMDARSWHDINKINLLPPVYGFRAFRFSKAFSEVSLRSCWKRRPLSSPADVQRSRNHKHIPLPVKNVTLDKGTVDAKLQRKEAMHRAEFSRRRLHWTACRTGIVFLSQLFHFRVISTCLTFILLLSRDAEQSSVSAKHHLTAFVPQLN